ncbi:hypothetical protein PARPLA_01899 [Rhodobacteraceae bacterium THAF1]|uniref:DUF924 family protein n=1 Tax=Palleronia sp. THAF1 TaxID=2587842 RepID=UPI000F3D4AF2|nr:DUF924 family protein [Palleronia sp. THAF1]QFU08966.1 hypothetical protein FIU81_09805 [Palleronia sp. THAF1]VDC24295.1 hypothetical protein PARPLA_01899 [Rhodobacteraceae bacterium THAF1]
MATPEEVLAFWLDDVGPKGWYAGGDELDETCRDRFAEAWADLDEGGLSLWLTYPSGVLAYIILSDQLPRNMWRGTPDAFKLDAVAGAAAKMAIGKGWDKRIDPPGRQFFYLPLMHAENLIDQDRCVRLFYDRMPEAENNLLHAKAHREVIRRFGRFPHRNETLGRSSTSAETAFIKDGGYGAVVRELQQTA